VSARASLFALLRRWPKWWPIEVYSIGPWPREWARTSSFRKNRPRLPRVGLLNWHGPPPYGVRVKWMRFGLVYWLPRWYCLRRWLGA
jgi:hypothetical protein